MQIQSRPRRTPLAWRNLVHHKPTMLISVAAITFAVMIMFMEIGFLNGLYDSQPAVLEAFHADLVMVSRALHIFNSHETFARSRLVQAAGFDGVARVCPVYIEDRLSDLRNPTDGLKHSIQAIGFDPDSPVFEDRRITGLAPQLRQPLTLLFDRRSRSFFGPLKAGMATELADRRVTVGGTFDLGPNYYYDGNVLTSLDTFFTLFPNQRRERVFIGLIQLDKGASQETVLRGIRSEMAPDVEVMTKAEIVAREKATWRKATPAGYVFTMGVAVGFVIGVFIGYQILYTDITDQLPQLATLRAMGYRDRDLVRLILSQATLLGLLGFLPAVIMTFGLYGILTAITGILTKLTISRVALVFALTLGMCVVAGALAARKALTADPAELF